MEEENYNGVQWTRAPLEGAPVEFRNLRTDLEDFFSDHDVVGSPERWRLSYALAARGECRLLQNLLEDNGFALTSTRAFNLLWLNCPVKPALLLSLNKYQKVNHFPRTQELTRKDLLTRTMEGLRERHGPGACDWFPQTFVLPSDADACHHAMARERALWIVKPIASSRGRGISIVQQPHQLPQDDVVVSRYVANPLLIDGFKFDLRLYVAVTSFHPLRIYLYEEGLARFSTEPYNAGASAAVDPPTSRPIQAALLLACSHRGGPDRAPQPPRPPRTSSCTSPTIRLTSIVLTL